MDGFGPATVMKKMALTVSSPESPQSSGSRPAPHRNIGGST
jgi:hypothetical protein